MKHYAWIAAAALATSACSALAPNPEARHVVRGPLPLRVQHPLALTFLNLGARRPVTQAPGAIEASLLSTYTSIFQSQDDPPHNVQFDGELWRNSARIRVGTSPGVDFETEFAWMYASGGFLDHFIQQFHDFIGVPNEGRERVEDDQFDMRIESSGRALYELEPYTIGLQDVPLIATIGEPIELVGRWNRAIRLGIEFPIGSADDGFGNGGCDYGIGFCAEKSSGLFTHHIAANVVFPSRPEHFVGSGIDVEDLYELVYGCEVRWSDRGSWIAQVDALSPMVTDIDLEEIDAPIVNLGVGYLRDLSDGSRVSVSFVDDVVSHTGPDFSVMVGWTVGF